LSVRVLVVRRDNIGDLVCTTPLLAGLRASYPQAHIAALVTSYNAAVLEGNPNVDEVHCYTKLKHRLPGQSRVGIVLARLRMLARLRRQPFDYIVLAKAGFDRQGLSLARQLRRREVVGYAPPGGRARGLTLAVPGEPDPQLHEVQVMERIGAALGISEARGPLAVYPNAGRMQAWRTRLPSLAERVRPWVTVHISAREPGRLWPARNWVELIRYLVQDAGAGVVLVWSPGRADDPRHPGDDEKAAEILHALRGLAGVLPGAAGQLEDLVALLALSDAFIGADGGAMHLAAGVRLPVVALFENLEAKKKRWYPWGVPYEMVAPQTRDIADIPVVDVIDAWRRLSSSLPLARRAPQARKEIDV
jgi:ADP-heptose:LPS heptosyltransferase